MFSKSEIVEGSESLGLEVQDFDLTQAMLIIRAQVPNPGLGASPVLHS